MTPSPARFVRPVLAILVLIGVLAGVFWWSREGGEVPLVLYGNVDIREVDLAFRQPGRVARLLVDEGATVTKGQLLAELDAQPFEDAMAVAQAAEAQAAAELEKLRKGNRSQEIEQARAEMRRAEAAALDARLEYERVNSLLASGAVSERATDAARSARDQTSAALSAARQALSLRVEGARSEDIAAAEARMAYAGAQLQQARTALEDTRLVAPADAVVSVRLLEAGSMATANLPVFTLSLQAPVYVRAYVSEPQLRRVRPGGKVTIALDGGDERYEGTIGFISPRAEFTPKSVETTELRSDLVYRIRIVVAGDAKALRQGMPVTVHVHDATP